MDREGIDNPGRMIGDDQHPSRFWQVVQPADLDVELKVVGEALIGVGSAEGPELVRPVDGLLIPGKRQAPPRDRLPDERQPPEDCRPLEQELVDDVVAVAEDPSSSRGLANPVCCLCHAEPLEVRSAKNRANGLC